MFKFFKQFVGLSLLFVLYLHSHLSFAGWLKLNGEAQLFATQKYSSYDSNYKQNLTIGDSMETADVKTKTQTMQYDLFAELGLTKKTSIIFSSLVTQLNQDVYVQSQSYQNYSVKKDSVINYGSVGLRRQLFRGWNLAGAMQTSFINPGQMSDEQKSLFGYTSKTAEARLLLGAGTGEVFLNHIIQSKFKKHYIKQTKVFAIAESGIRKNTYYNFYELRNDYTLALELNDLGVMMLLQMFDIYRFRQQNNMQNLTLRKFSLSTVNKFTDNLWVSFGMEKETDGYLNRSANIFSIGVWLVNS